MFWFSRNRLSGSNRRLSSASRWNFASPYAARTRASPSLPRKFTYTPPVENGASADANSRFDASCIASSDGSIHIVFTL